MHELGIATAVMDAARVEAARHAARRVAAIGLRIGDLSAVDEASLRFCFEALARGTEFETTRLEVERSTGDELDVQYLELEDDDEAGAGGAQGSE